MADRNHADILLMNLYPRLRAGKRWPVAAFLISGAMPGCAQVAENGTSQGLDITTAGSLTVGFIFLLILVIAIVIVRRRMEEQKAREAMADAAFEMQVMASFRHADASAISLSPPGQHPASFPDSAPFSPISEVFPETTFAPEGIAPAAETVAIDPPANRAVAGDSNSERADIVASGAISQLRHAGMLTDNDGYMELNGNPQGAVILRLKDGRRALLVPYHETEVFTRRNLRRFDLLIYVGRDGKAVVVTALESVIADRLSSRF